MIHASLWLSGLLAEFFADTSLSALSFGAGLLLIALTVVASGLVKREIWRDVWLVVGMLAVYGMVLVRLGLQERSHLIEFSVLALIIYSALLERRQNGGTIKMPGVMAITITTLIGVLDEIIQIFLPNRVFDPQDMLFNTLAALLAVGSISSLRWISRRIRQKTL